MRRLATILATSVAVFGMLAGTSAQAGAPPVDPDPSASPISPSPTASATPNPTATQPTLRTGQEALFNYPVPGTPDMTLSDKLVSLIDDTPEGEQIHLSYFVAQPGHPVVDALLRAYSRGVSIRVVLDSGDNQRPKKNVGIDEAYARLAETLGTDTTRQCNRSCISDVPDSINHNKFATFSRTGEAEKVVFQSTANLRLDGSGDSAYNSAVVIYGNQPVYDQYVSYFEDLYVERGVTKDNYDGYRPSITSGPVSPHFFPRTDKVDTLASALATMNCAATQSGIRVMAPFFARKKLRNTLVDLSNAGCVVLVLARQDTITQDFCKSLGPKISVKITPSAKRDRVTIHSKYVLVNGNYGGLNDQTITWMGSHNFTDNSLVANDETFVQFTDPSIYSAFSWDWDRLWNDPAMTPGCIRAGARSEAEVERRADTETTKLSRRSQTVKRGLPRTLRTTQPLPPPRTAQGQRLTTVATCKPLGSGGTLRKNQKCKIVKRKGRAVLMLSSPKPLRVRIEQKARGSKRLLPYSRMADYRYSPGKGLARRV